MSGVCRPVVGYEGIYTVTLDGVVTVLERYIRHPRGGLTLRRAKQMKINFIEGYPVLNLTKDGVHRTSRLHRIIWEAFVGPIPADKVLNHKDGVKSNFTLDNLEVVSIGDNNRHAVRTGLLVPNPVAMHVANRRSVIQQDRSTGAVIAVHPGIRVAAKATGVNANYISDSCRNPKHTAGGFGWAYNTAGVKHAGP